ncbi:MAG: beta-lactamase family protein [Clostridia bacterium]|nr:beta-lactamase family protein [Clostridia bacterium]
MNFDRMKAFQERLVNWRIPGSDCMIVKDGKEIYRYMTGWADKESGRKMSGDELYYFWSASKVITCSLGLRLHEEGLFAMNDPLYEYMPEFRNMTVRKKIDGRDEIVPAEKPILVKHLFNMTAGFDYNLNTPAVKAVGEATDGKYPTREVAKAIAESPLCFEPGTHWQYSLCHDVLGALIGVIAGKRMRDYAKEVLFDPLGMNDTCYNLPDEAKMKRLATQYNYRDDLGKYLPTNNTCGHILGSEYDSGGAGIVSGCADYMKFAYTMANGGTSTDGYRYLSPASVDLMRMNTLNDDLMRDFNWSQMVGYGYGCGVRTMVDPAKAGALSPCGEFGWGGAAGVWVIIDPDNRLALVYTQHMLNNQENFISPRIRNILYGCM